MRRLALAVAVTVLLAGCAGIGQPDVEPKPEPPKVGERLGDAPNGGTWRFVDDEAGVVCYIINEGGDGEAIDCLPLNETRLDA